MRLEVQSFIDSLVQFDMSDGLPLTQRALIAYERHVKDQLNCILSIPEESEMDFVTSLNELLKAIWSLTKGTMLCYTAQPNHPVTLFMCKVAGFVAKENHSDTEFKSPLGFLMPDMKELESNSDGYLMLDHIALEELVKSHVLSQDGKYLLPASSLLSEQYTSVDAKSDPVPNPYWDATEVDNISAAYISQADLTKLERHSNLTMAVAKTKRALFQLLEEKSNLLGQLRELVSLLTLNDANHRGSEVDAGGGAYPAILRFKYYYDSLTQRDKNSIPANLKHEIELLLCLACNKEENRDAVDTIETCIATRRDKLLIAMRGSNAILSQIGSSDQTRAACIRNARVEYDNALKSLRLAVREGARYIGRDQPLITTKLLRDLNIRLSIESKSDLMQLALLPSDDLNQMLSENEVLKNQIMREVWSGRNFAKFCTGLPYKSLAVFLDQCGDSIVENAGVFPRTFSYLLSSLSVTRCAAVCQGLKRYFIHLFKSTDNFRKIFELLLSRDRRVLLESIKSMIPEMIKDGPNLRRVIMCLGREEFVIVFESIKDKLSDLIDNASTFFAVFSSLTCEQRLQVFEIIKINKLINIIDCAVDFKLVYCKLNQDQRTVFFKAMKGKLPKLIKDSSSFSHVLIDLTPE